MPDNHLPWINHLVTRGSVVVYPRYEMATRPSRCSSLRRVQTAEKSVDSTTCPCS